jgi:RNA polymerase sigma-70 factor (ECF subfamily)
MDPRGATTVERPEELDDDWVDARYRDAWSDDRRHLLDVAYRLLGSVSDAQDMVQEAFYRLLRASEEVDDVRGWLTVVVSRLCLDELRSARVRREAQVGPWFPEPLVDGASGMEDPAERVTLDDSVRMALLILLERLSPAERVAYVLHDIFQFDFDAVGRVVGRSPVACRQLASRARRRVADGTSPARFEVEPAEQMRVAERFVAAAASGELAPLLKVLDPSVLGWADTGGARPELAVPLVGREHVAARMLPFVAGPGAGLRVVPVNGEPGIMVTRHGEVAAVLLLTVRNGLITRIEAIADPRKLTHVAVASRLEA